MRRILLGVSVVVLTATIGLAACSSDDDGGSASTDAAGSAVDSVGDDTTGVQSTPFATVPPTSTTSPPTSTTPPQPGDTIPTESRYTIVSGDYPSTVASKFKVEMQAMLDLNGFVLEENGMVPLWPQPGTEIKIPAGATVPNPDGTSATDPPADGGDGTEGTGGDADAPSTTVDICAASTYEIQEGDVKFTVALKFDTTVEALDAANVNTPNYESFIVGFDIVIPAKTDC